MNLRTGDRVRVESTADDGLPLVRYGFVDGVASRGGPVVVMLDGELNAEVIDISQVQPVEITTIELCLWGDGLTDDPELRRGLVALWRAEADTAGLDVDALHPLDEGLRDAGDSWVLAELAAGGQHYVVRAVVHPDEPDVVRIRADRPNRWSAG